MTSKRYKALPQETKKLKQNTIENLLKIVKQNCTTKLEESIDVNFLHNLKQKKNEINIRTVLNLPVGTNKNISVAVVCEEEKLEEAQKLEHENQHLLDERRDQLSKVEVALDVKASIKLHIIERRILPDTISGKQIYGITRILE